jgi:hypothetical protein
MVKWIMGILDNFEEAWDDEFNFDSPIYKPEMENLSVKIFSDLVCNDCLSENESKAMPITDNMGREMFWNDAGRPENP